MNEEKGIGAYLILFLIVSIIGAVIGVFVANLAFVQWQKIPMQYYSYHIIYDYYKQYGHVPEVLKALKICAGVGGFVIVLFDAIIAMAIFAKPKRELHGSARYANDMEIRKAGFILTPKQQEKKYKNIPSEPPILVGKYNQKFLEFFGNEFVFVAAPTRSGKGVGIVIPNLLHYPDSCVVLDIKNENWDITAGFRSKYQNVYLFSPAAADNASHRYNPLDYIDRSEVKRIPDIQNVASILFPTQGVDDTTAYFNGQAQRLFTGLILYMMETPDRPCTMAELIKLSTPTMGLPEWIENIIQERKTKEIVINTATGEKALRPLPVECIEALMTFGGNSSENTRAGILSSMMTPLFIFTDPMVAAATSESDFRLDEVRKKKMTIYVGIQPNELPRFDKLLNLFFSQLINLNTRVLPQHDKSLKWQCLVLLDEFTALGCVEIINKAVAYIAGYNMRLMLIFQNKSQSEQYYGKEGSQTLLGNMAVQVIYTPQTLDDADFYSKLLGTETVKGRSISKNRGKGGGGSTSESDQRRELLLPQELMEFDSNKELVKFRGLKPIECHKIKYYEDEVLAQRANMAIHEKHLPRKLDVNYMLEVMRGTKFEQIKSIADLPTAKTLVNEHANYIKHISDALGFDADFFNVESNDEIVLVF